MAYVISRRTLWSSQHSENLQAFCAMYCEIGVFPYQTLQISKSSLFNVSRSRKRFKLRLEKWKALKTFDYLLFKFLLLAYRAFEINNYVLNSMLVTVFDCEAITFAEDAYMAPRGRSVEAYVNLLAHWETQLWEQSVNRYCDAFPSHEFVHYAFCLFLQTPITTKQKVKLSLLY